MIVLTNFGHSNTRPQLIYKIHLIDYYMIGHVRQRLWPFETTFNKSTVFLFLILVLFILKKICTLVAMFKKKHSIFKDSACETGKS